jgi:hypothetical protein
LTTRDAGAGARPTAAPASRSIALAAALSAATFAPLVPVTAGAADAEAAPYVDELVLAARAGRLAADRDWLKLLHYHRQLFRLESDADGPAFFLAPDGKRDPAAELEATLRGFFERAPPSSEAAARHALCRFPARLLWLADRLAIERARLPAVRCEGLATFLTRVEARSVTLVFSSYYLNNPASAFGHTFLRLNKAEAATAGKRVELVDYGIDYAATVDTGNVLLYAVKGVSGLFHGNWNHYPYFYKVRQYADYESRDLWEYDLAFSPRETAMLAAHLWELGGTWFDYYYLTENCSYGILAALEAAAPRLELLRHVGYIVIPADTVKALYANDGLVRTVHFRPSIRTQFNARAATLSASEVDAVRALVERPEAAVSGLSVVSEARALDAALDYVDLANAHELLDGVVTPAAELKQKLMERRSALLVQSDDLAIAAPVLEQPQLGHGSLRTGFGGGWSSRKGALATYDLRLGLHDLVDPPRGYPALAQIDFLRFRLRYEPRSNTLGVEEGVFADIASISDFGPFDRHLTWRARLGATTVRDAGCRGCLAAAGTVGGGLGKVLLGGRLTAFAVTDAEVVTGPHLDGIDGAGVRLGVGPGAGVRLQLGERLALLGEGGWRWLPAAGARSTFELRAQARFHLARFTAWLEASRWPIESQALAGVSLFL